MEGAIPKKKRQKALGQNLTPYNEITTTTKKYETLPTLESQREGGNLLHPRGTISIITKKIVVLSRRTTRVERRKRAAPPQERWLYALALVAQHVAVVNNNY